MKIDLLIKDGKIVTQTGIYKANVVIKKGKIAGIVDWDEDVKSEETIDASGKLVFPGVIDSHVHFNEPGREEWEGFESGSKSAAAGGITTFIDMPLNSKPCTLKKSLLLEKIKIGEEKSITDFALWGGATPDNINNLQELNDEGVAAYKSFLCYSGIDEFKNIDDGEFLEIMRIIGKLNNVMGIHAENGSIADYFTKNLKKEGRKDRKAYIESRPKIVETEAVNNLLFMLLNTKIDHNLHFVHISTPESLDLINQAKINGIKVTAETCPHYLTLTDEDFVKIGPIAKCSPPLRSQKEREKLWEYIKKGYVDTIGSDHSPSTEELKIKGEDDIWEAWGGISGIQTMLPIMFSEGHIKRGISLCRLVRMMSYNPSVIFGLFPQKGNIAPGADADLVIFDPEKEWVVDKDMLYYKNKITPFLGIKITGSVEKTIIRGKLVYDNGEIKINPGYGRFIHAKRVSL